MRGPAYEKPDGDTGYLDKIEGMKKDAEIQHWMNHRRENPFYYFIGKMITKMVLLFILSFPAAWAGTKITPANLLLFNQYSAKYLQYFSIDKLTYK
jgi:hypothetical protein